MKDNFKFSKVGSFSKRLLKKLFSCFVSNGNFYSDCVLPQRQNHPKVFSSNKMKKMIRSECDLRLLNYNFSNSNPIRNETSRAETLQINKFPESITIISNVNFIFIFLFFLGKINFGWKFSIPLQVLT